MAHPLDGDHIDPVRSSKLIMVMMLMTTLITLNPQP